MQAPCLKILVAREQIIGASGAREPVRQQPCPQAAGNFSHLMPPRPCPLEIPLTIRGGGMGFFWNMIQ